MDLFVVLIVVFAIVQAASKSKKKQAKQQPVRRHAVEEIFGPDNAAPASASPRKAKPATKPVARPAEMLPTIQQETPRAPIAPRVHVHTAPACAEDDDTGSLHYASTEGVDPCHAGQLPPMEQPRPPVMESPMAETPGLTLEWTGENMVKAFIMQEVLTRPCERQGRR